MDVIIPRGQTGEISLAARTSSYCEGDLRLGRTARFSPKVDDGKTSYLGKTSKFITTSCSENAAAFISYTHQLQPNAAAFKS